MSTKLHYFLNGRPDAASDTERSGRKVTEKDKPFTLWSFDNKTKWFIAEDDRTEFYRLYCADLRKSIPQFLTERSTPVGQMRIDLDFKYSGRVEEHKHTQEQVTSFVRAYLAEAKRWVNVPDIVEAYVLEKETPTYDPIHSISSSGVHIQFPELKTRAGVEQGIRRTLISRMEEFFPNLGCTKGWDDIYDKSPLTHTGNWPLLGSKKPTEGSLPYEIKYILNWDAETDEISAEMDVSPVPTVDLVHKLSVRSSMSEEIPLTEFGKANTRAPQEPILRAVSRGRSDVREQQGSRGASPGGRNREPLSDIRKNNIAAHVMNLADFRHSGPHDEYVKVGQCLYNIHPYDLEDVWLDFMEKASGDRRSKALEKWRGFNERVDGGRMGEGRLRFWSRTDNYEEYNAIELTNVDRLVDEAAATATEHDVAQVIYGKYRDEFKCASVKNNDWYQYIGHIWRSSESGVDLLARFSSEVAKLFRDKEIAELNSLDLVGECVHKDYNPGCPSCETEKRKKSYAALRLKLKTTGFKGNVMKECSVLFRDSKFMQSLDENKHLIAFNNGVFDTSTLTFRDGKPDDYISFCTNLDFATDKRYDQFKCWTELEKFLHSILPNEKVRSYFLKSLCLCLAGEFVQRFHIMTGSGSNGKSMLMNLMGTAMGDYCYKANIAMFTQKRGKAGAAAPEMVRLKGRRFVTMSEPDEGEPLSTGFLKELTGSEKVSCRDLYAGSKQMVEFDVTCKFFLSCNEKPPIKTCDGGTWRRLKVIDFPSKFVHHPTLPHELPIDESIMHKVQTEEWSSAFMAYMIHLYKEGHGWRKLSPPPEVDVYTSEYQEESDIIARFMRECFRTEGAMPGEAPESVHWNTVTATFQEWKRSNEVNGRGTAADLKKRIEGQFGKMPRGGWINFEIGAN